TDWVDDRASFETPAGRAPQDDGLPLCHHHIHVILRSAEGVSRRTQYRDAAAIDHSPITAKRSHWICIGGLKSPLATVWRAGRECGSGNISTQYLLRVGRSARSVIHTVILTMSSGVPPAASISRRTLANIAAHCASRSSGTLPVAESAPEMAPEATNGP